MSFFDKIFGTSASEDTNPKVVWKYLTDGKDLDAANQLSFEKPVVLFKHSTRCSVSRFALKQFENNYDLNDAMDLYFLDLIAYRATSNEIATRFTVEHQSPQLIVLKNGIAVYNASHDAIDASSLKKFL